MTITPAGRMEQTRTLVTVFGSSGVAQRRMEMRVTDPAAGKA